MKRGCSLKKLIDHNPVLGTIKLELTIETLEQGVYMFKVNNIIFVLNLRRFIVAKISPSVFPIPSDSFF